MAKPRVYLETSFISYMVGRETTNVKIVAEQAWPRKWRRSPRLAMCSCLTTKNG